jgi:hypothetical protein
MRSVIAVLFGLWLTGCAYALGPTQSTQIVVGNNLVQDASALTVSPYVGHDWFFRDGWSVRVELAPVGWAYASYRIEKRILGSK